MSGLTAKLNKLIDKLLDRLPERFAAAGVIKRFFNIQFMTFALIGVINTLGMIVFTACMVSVSDRLPDGAAAVSDRLCIPFAAGYALSVVLSFFLNCRFTFKCRPDIKKFIKFPLGYIPNFLFQYILAAVFRAADVSRAAAYISAAVLGVPATFASMRFLVFAENNKNSR